jgi:hypothetical protein
VQIASRFNGPPDSGNGGYSCGVFALAYGAPGAEVTLRLPPPLDTPLTLDGGTVLDGDKTVATVNETSVDLTPPPSPGVDEARRAEGRYAGLHDHPFPTCFVCGPQRTDGLGLKPGETDGIVATTWTPESEDPRLVWAALDCPSGWAFLKQSYAAPMMLGRLAARIDRTPTPHEQHVVVAWEAAPADGRKHYSASALYDATGTLLAVGKATWIQLSGAS